MRFKVSMINDFCHYHDETNIPKMRAKQKKFHKYLSEVK